MTVDLHVPCRGTVAPVSKFSEKPAVVAAAAGSTTENGRLWSARSQPSGQVHFDLDSEALPDMVCGNDGVGFQQVFRPSHFTVTWSGGEIVEVRIWGPRVLKDGSTGKRLLDHCWRRRPIDLARLPELVQVRIREHAG